VNWVFFRHPEQEARACPTVVHCFSPLTDIEVDLVGIGADGRRDVRVRTAPGWVGRCPLCQVVSTRSKGWVVTRPKDVKVGPDFGEPVVVQTEMVVPQHLLCERKQFTESVPQIPPRARFTARAKAEMAAAVLDGWRSVAEVAHAWGTTWNTCHRAVVAMADPILATQLAPIRVLGIDCRWSRNSPGVLVT
jgi:transposase